MKVIQGDLVEMALQGKFDVIIHGCNCYCTMGSGIARTIRETFPEAFEADRKTKRGDPDKLGTITFAVIPVGISCVRDTADLSLHVVNAYTQFGFGPGLQVDYEATRAALKKVKCQFTGLRIGYPKIGAGLGGGDWEILSAIFDEELNGEDHTLVEFQS
jgi:O-acetyl-ADP-ribose deacetylase (regulator of RNase III)